MAVFNKNTLYQISGFDNPIISGELVYQQQTYWNIRLTSGDLLTPVNLTGATIDATIVQRTVTNVNDTRNGLTFDIGNYVPTPTPVALTIANRNDAGGSFTLVIDDAVWGFVAGDPGLAINANDPIAFSGRIKIGFPAASPKPADDTIIFLFFLVRSDGVINIS